MQMKKRVLSAFMALCMVCSLVGAAWAVIPQQTSAAANGQFTISWNGYNSITVHLVDETGKQLPIDVDFSSLNNVYNPTDFADKFIENQWVSIEELAATWASQTEGYTYVGAYRSNVNSNNQIYWLNCRTNTYGQGTRFNEWRYSDQQTAPTRENGGNSWENRDLYLVYNKVTEITPNPNLTISDTVSADGSLTAQYQGTGATYYVWEKSENGTDWTTISRLKMNGDQYNLSKDGQTLNAALEVVNDVNDSGGQWFRVSAYANQEAYESKQAALATSAAMQLNYYDELRNGSFEQPVVADLSTGNKSNYQYPVGSEDLIWRTTGNDQQIEIVNENGSSASSDYHNSDGAQSGTQYAELNCQAAGALYQDVLTVPGTSLNWQLYHRGRDGKDTMYLVIAPTNKVDTITTQQQLITLIEKIQRNKEQSAAQGYYLYEITDDNQDWCYYSSNSQGAEAYTVPDSQYLTRFFFVAGETAYDRNNPNSGNKYTIGNLLDDVRFTTELLPAQAGTANLEITKVVSGVENLPDNYSVTVNVNLTEVVLNNFRQQSDGNFVATGSTTVGVNANQTVNLTVTEENPPAIMGYNFSGTTVQTGDNQAQPGASTNVTLAEQETGEVTFTNTYTPKEPTDLGLGVGKTADRVDSDGTYDLTLSVTGDQITETGEKQQLDVLFILDESNSMCDYFGYNQTRIAVAKQAIQQISGYGNYDGLSDNEALDVKYALVGFYGGKDRKNNNNKYNDATTLCNWTDNVNILINRTPGYLDDGRDDGGTNYEAGFRTGKTVLNQARNDAQKVVIFLSDGNPTYYYNENGYTAGNGSNYDSTAQDHAKTELKTLDADYFYAVGVTNNVQDTVLQELVTAATEVAASNKGYYTSSNPDDLLDAFKDIQQQITTKTYQNVVMHDVLSEYAEFALGADQTEADLQFTVKVEQRGENGWQQVGNAQTVRLNQAANFTINNKNFSITPAYNSVTGEITATFSPEYQLESGYRYSVTVQIRPTQEAIQQYNQSSYPSEMIGDVNTGTHSGKNGFWSNDNDKAYVTYDRVTATTGSEPIIDPGKTPFPKPVIQVPDTGNLTITKAVEGVNSDQVQNQTYSFTITADGATAEKVSGNTYGAAAFTNGTATVSITGADSLTIENLPLGAYTVTENTTSLPDIDTDSDDDGDYYFSSVKYNDDEDAESTTATVTADATTTVTITNTYAPYRTVTITKDVGGNMGDTTNPFHFTTSVNETPFNSNNHSNATLSSSTTATWTQEGYTLADGDTITISKLKDGDVITLKETDGNSNGYSTVYKVDGETDPLTVDEETGNATHTVNGDANIIVTNERNVGTPTGFFEDNLPFTLMISAAGLAGIALIATILVRRQRRRRE